IALARILSLTLEEIGVQIIENTQNERDALKTLKALSSPIDLITIGVMNPTKDNLTTIPLIRAAHPESKIILITAVGGKDSVLEAIQMGADYYIIRPFNRDSVFKALKKLFTEKPPEAF
ncbi:MAG: response regulator, partial [Candidatus Methylumidiphilus sp.]